MPVIEVQKHPNGITTIRFNRPQVRNALNLEALQQFAQAVSSLHLDEQLRVVILTGTGTEAFCSGGDIQELSQYPSTEDGRKMSALMSDTLLKLERLPVPVIAAINGYALGGGSEIAVACDLRIVDEKAKLGFVQIRMSLTPGWGAGQRLLQIVGYAKTMELLLSGEIMSADELQSIGLANRVVEIGQAYEQALEFAEHIASQSPQVVRGIKQLLQAGRLKPYREALQIEHEIFPSLWSDEAHIQAFAKFLNKQKD